MCDPASVMPFWARTARILAGLVGVLRHGPWVGIERFSSWRGARTISFLGGREHGQSRTRLSTLHPEPIVGQAKMRVAGRARDTIEMRLESWLTFGMAFQDRNRINTGSYTSPYSGWGQEFLPLGVPPDYSGVVLHESGYQCRNGPWNFPNMFSKFWRLITVETVEEREVCERLPPL